MVFFSISIPCYLAFLTFFFSGNNAGLGVSARHSVQSTAAAANNTRRANAGMGVDAGHSVHSTAAAASSDTHRPRTGISRLQSCWGFGERGGGA